MDNSNVVVVSHLTKRFGNQLAVNNVSFSVKRGEVFGLLGPNGAGKTTLLRMMTTLLSPSDGTIQIFKQDVRKYSRKARALFALTGQYASVDEGLSAQENLMIFSRLNGLTRKQAKKRTEELLIEFSLTEFAHKKLSDFSGGMRRRLDLAVSLISHPPLIFLDEPTTGLDPRTRHQLWATIRKFVQTGSTIILTTQYLDEADALANRVAVIDHGQLIKIGKPEELKAQVATEKLKLAFSSPSLAKSAQILLTSSFEQSSTLSHDLLTINLTQIQQLSGIILKLHQADFRIDDVELIKPTLDDVFFALTQGTN